MPCGCFPASWRGAASRWRPKISACRARPSPMRSSSWRPGSACACSSAPRAMSARRSTAKPITSAACRILADIEDAEGAFAGAKPKGMLRVDVHGTLARHFVLPSLPSFLETYPDIEFYMSEGDRLVDLVREGIDCVLRVGTPQDSDMVARRVAMLEEITLASPAYIDSHGLPEHPDKLDGHRMVGFRSTATGGVLPLEFLVDGSVRNITLPATVTVNAAESFMSAARLGLGLIQVPRYHAEKDLADGTLVHVLAGFSADRDAGFAALSAKPPAFARAFASSSTGW